MPCTCHSNMSPGSVPTLFSTLWTLFCPFISPPTCTMTESTAGSTQRMSECLTDWLVAQPESPWLRLKVESFVSTFRWPYTICIAADYVIPSTDIDTPVMPNNQKSLRYCSHGCIFCGCKLLFFFILNPAAFIKRSHNCLLSLQETTFGLFLFLLMGLISC